MDAQTPPHPYPTSTVDASVPFRSVKEAVAIFKDRLFFKDNHLSQKQATFQVQDEASRMPDLIQSPDKPTSHLEDQDISLSFDTKSISLYPVIPSLGEPETDNVIPRPYKATRPFREGEDTPSYSSEITLDTTEPVSVNSTPLVESPMCEEIPDQQGNARNENHGNIVHGNDLVMMLMVLKKLEAELQETKTEVKLLKEKGTETEMILATLNAELGYSLSKIAKAEAVEPAKAAKMSVTVNAEGQNIDEERIARNGLMAKSIDSPTLAQILSISDYEGYFARNQLKTKKSMKKKPIMPLVTDLFLWKKKESPAHANSDPLFSKMYFT